MAGGIGGMNNASLAVPSLFGQVKGLLLIRIAAELHALIHQPVNYFTTVVDGKLYGVWVAEVGAGVEGVLDMRVNAVVFVQHRSDAALGVIGSPFV